MSDLISRQAVIDIIETDCSWDIFNEWGSRTPTGECIINAIKSVPSVEPESCGDCINRKDMLKKLNNLCNNTCDYSEIQRKSMCDACNLSLVFDMINNAKSVEPERKTGKWISTIHHCRRWMVCSQCGEEHIYDHFTGWNYCSSCGSRMEADR